MRLGTRWLGRLRPGTLRAAAVVTAVVEEG
jgi:hypothetical protein